jgi:hypothetical protein
MITNYNKEHLIEQNIELEFKKNNKTTQSYNY